MQNNIVVKVVYYFSLNIIGAGLGFGLLGFLNWPLLAEIPLALCIYVEVVAVGRSFYNSWISQTENSFSDFIHDLKIQLQQLENVENG